MNIFKVAKFTGTMFLGMLIAPKRGVEFRYDISLYLQKFKPKLRAFINAIDEVWYQTQNNKIEEISTSIEYKAEKLNERANKIISKEEEIDPYKAFKITSSAAKVVGKEIKHSENARRIAQELARVTISLVDGLVNVTKKSNEISKKVTQDIDGTKLEEED